MARKKRRTIQQKALRSPLRRRKGNSLSLPSLKVNEQQSQEMWGVFFGVLAILSFLGLSEQLGIFGALFADTLFSLFGKGAYAMPIAFGFLSLSFFFARKWAMNFTRLVGFSFFLIGGLGIVHTLTLSTEDSFTSMRLGGGFFGASGSVLPRYFLGDVGAIVLLSGITAIGAILSFPLSIAGILREMLSLFTVFIPEKQEQREKGVSLKKVKEMVQAVHQDPNIEEVRRKKLEQDRKEAEKRREEFRKKEAERKEKADRPLVSSAGEWEFPSLSLLENKKMAILTDEKELEEKELLIQEKLLEFGIGCDRGPANAGPTVTQYTIKPQEGVKLSKITSLKNDLTLALSASNIRIEAPIPGKDLVGIEIPNEKRATVYLKEVLESKEFEQIKSSMRLALGRDVAGNAVVANLSDMPHLLIAGATGAGKSVGMNAFLVSLLYQNSPADLKLILVDPKRVELAPYNNIPHLLTPVITESDKALSALRWAVAEMMRRYGELAKKGYRNAEEFNEREQEKMPKIVIVVDELADLMMRQLKKETEAAICRLAQMARAVGMHLIIATQRPSVDVITGLIKANIPTRIAFAVTSAVDSRTILDCIGAEDLLGKGDMLFSNAALTKPQRIQGIFISTDEVNRVTNRLKIIGQPEYDESILEGDEEREAIPGFDDFGSEGGDINQKAIEVIRQTGKASASLLQRRLSVGYARAARILDELEEQGLIGPARGAKPREIYL